MKKLFPILFVLIISSCSDPQSTTSDKLTERNNISYFGNSKTPFTGEIIDYHLSTPSLKMTGKFVDGKKEGQWDLFYFQLNGEELIKESEEFYTNGEKNGKFISFEEDGSIKSTTWYVRGEFEETLNFKGSEIDTKIYQKNNRIYNIRYPRHSENVDENYHGVIYCKITDKTTNKQVDLYNEQHTDGVRYLDYYKKSFETWKDCQLNGEFEKYLDGVYISSKGSYKNGEPTGEWITYDEDTGDPSEITNYKEGKKDGLVQTFHNNSKNIERQEFYKEGFLESLQKFTKKGYKYQEQTFTRDGRSQSKSYITFCSSDFNEHPDFHRVMKGFWYCDDDDSPITVTESYLGGKKDGLFEVSDTVDGHVYTSINYSRGGKLGDYKITNKDGLVVYSVTCLNGGHTFFEHWNTLEGHRFLTHPLTGNCRKDGVEVTYLWNHPESGLEKGWKKFSEITFKDDRIIKSRIYGSLIGR